MNDEWSKAKRLDNNPLFLVQSFVWQVNTIPSHGKEGCKFWLFQLMDSICVVVVMIRDDRYLRSAISFFPIHLDYFESWRAVVEGRVLSIWIYLCEHLEIQLVGMSKSTFEAISRRINKSNFTRHFLEGQPRLAWWIWRQIIGWELLLDSLLTPLMLSLMIQKSRIRSVSCQVYSKLYYVPFVDSISRSLDQFLLGYNKVTGCALEYDVKISLIMYYIQCMMFRYLQTRSSKFTLLGLASYKIRWEFRDHSRQ